MQTKIIDGRKIRDEVLESLKKDIESLPFSPIFCDVLVGNDLNSAQYVRMKARVAESVGIKFRTADFDKSVSTESLSEEINNLNRVPHMCGIIIQLPLPDHINKNAVLDTIDPKLDVDCLGQVNSDHFYNNESYLNYPTALACLYIIESLNIDLSSKKILVLGQGHLVGKPVAHILRQKGFIVDIADRNTSNTLTKIQDADLIISAIGRGKFIKGDMIKNGVILIDAGTSEDNGAVVGDVDLESVLGKASFVSPTPGGVGPVTVAMLLSNILKVAKNKI